MAKYRLPICHWPRGRRTLCGRKLSLSWTLAHTWEEVSCLQCRRREAHKWFVEPCKRNRE
jgi:hypothetical protein